MASAIADQVAAGEPGIIGVMVESFLVDGRQDLTDRSRLTVGQSITDACMGWDMTVPVLRELASAVRARRPLLANRDTAPVCSKRVIARRVVRLCRRELRATSPL